MVPARYSRQFLLYPVFLIIHVPVMGYDAAFLSPFSKYSI
jgi:hypothetical protein